MPKLTVQELQDKLEQQIRLLKNFVNLFDEGDTDIIPSIATAIRVLVHDTRASTSLLQTLNIKSKSFYDTALPYVNTNMTTHSGLTVTAVNTNNILLLPILDEGPYKKYVPFED